MNEFPDKKGTVNVVGANRGPSMGDIPTTADRQASPPGSLLPAPPRLINQAWPCYMEPPPRCCRETVRPVGSARPPARTAGSGPIRRHWHAGQRVPERRSSRAPVWPRGERQGFSWHGHACRSHPLHFTSL